MSGRDKAVENRQRGRGVMPVLVTIGAVGLLAAVAFLMLGGDPQSYLREEYRQETAIPAMPASPATTETGAQDPAALMTLRPSSRRILVAEDRKDPVTPSGSPLPALNDSDQPVRKEVVELASSSTLADWLIDEELVRKFVVTVDNVARGEFPHKHSLLKPIRSGFRAVKRQEGFWLDGYNYSRYTPYVDLFVTLDVAKQRDLYLRYYPLMQQAYAELGYPRASFHKRMLEALDHLLESPVREGAIELAQGASGVFQYADPELEARSDVHKQMLRLGPANARRVLERLTLLRTELARLEHP